MKNKQGKLNRKVCKSFLKIINKISKITKTDQIDEPDKNWIKINIKKYNTKVCNKNLRYFWI